MQDEDKRIKKTKKALKQALLHLLETYAFEELTVKEICAESDVSRLTFYNHYKDKYDLANELMLDMVNVASDDYHAMQAENNPEHNSVQSYLNLLDCILKLYHLSLTFFAKKGSGANPYLSFAFCDLVLKYIEDRIEKESEHITPKYSAKKASHFICYGLWGFVSESHAEGCTLDQIRAECRDILAGLLKTDVLTEKREAE